MTRPGPAFLQRYSSESASNTQESKYIASKPLRGAALPYALGRLARNHAVSQGKYADPRKGFEAMYFDSCVFDSDSLEYLAKKATPERIMLGSDAPFPIGDPQPKRSLEGAYFNDGQ